VAGFTLFLKHAGKFSMVLSVGGLFMVLGKISVASLTTLCGFLIMDAWPAIKESLASPVFPLVVIFVIAYTIAAVFISLYGISSNAILQCFLVDVDISEQDGKQGGSHRPPALEKFVYIAAKDQEPTKPVGYD
jgi:choline transporter-like protein 2/4/5